MVTEVFWTDFAKSELKNIFNYYKLRASSKVAHNLIEGIVNKANSLDFQFKIGQKEDLLLERKEEFRYLIYKSYKIIYWFNQDKSRVEITDVFDVRQNPLKLKRQK